MIVAALTLIVSAALVITHRSYGPHDARRSWATGWHWLLTRGAVEALAAGVVIGVVLVVIDAVIR